MELIKQLVAFTEYVVRPLSEDWRIILEKIKELDLPITTSLIRDVALWSMLTHIVLELVKWGVYLTITWLVCQTVVRVL